ncbi:MAG TPA: PQQ-dependent sugar dehydrogenase [Thermoanaerobaculia bacterium]|nr:PQQ-dependent sugar dehydrogenase [Thermoanaerobaculia bacterium]
MKSVLVAVLLLSPPLIGQEIVLQRLAGGIDKPVGISQARDGRLFILTQHGQIRIWDGTRLLERPFLDITPQVLCCGERGLLGLAFHPRFEENGLFYIDYVDFDGNLVVDRYKVSADDRDVADERSSTVVLTVEHTWGAHYAGQLAFGPDGYLYISVGDGDEAGDPHGNAQNLDSLLGKILRIDVDAAAPYAIPPSNPFAGAANARGEIWSYGLRNPWRFSFDRMTGDLWIADVGEAEWEEIDVQSAASAGAENFGWPQTEGDGCFDAESCDMSQITEPVLERNHAGGDCAVIGGYRYWGGDFPRLRGTYVYGDYCSGRIWGALPRPDGTWSSRLLLQAPFRISSFGEDAAGELYVLDYSGSLFRIRDAVPYVPRRRAVSH